jgi:toxin-antitoxin system PIN domain toxin
VFVIDTNILLYAADPDAAEHTVCRNLLESCREDLTPWYLTWGIAYEFVRVATHPSVFQKPFQLAQAWNFMLALLASPSLELLIETNRHAEICSEVFLKYPEIKGNVTFDAHTAILMKEHGVKTIYTRDSDFRRFEFLEVVDPMR